MIKAVNNGPVLPCYIEFGRGIIHNCNMAYKKILYMQSLSCFSRIKGKGVRAVNEPLYTDDYIQRMVEKYSDMLIRIALLHMKNRSDAEDAAQDIFMKLIEKPRIFESVEHEKAWLIRVAVNLCKDRLKMVWFRKVVMLEENQPAPASENSEIIDALMDLPLKYRSIILLFYYEGYSIREIGKILNLRESTVGSQLHRARKLLKIKLEEDFDHE
jgi:RNA polymerase sigma-70 factor (ECF subfamily)